MAPKKERDEAIAAFTSRVLTSMLEETLMDVVLQSHQEIARARAVCGVCHTRCGSVHVPGPSSSGGASTRPSPPDGTKSHEGGTAPGTGANTPTNGNIASNRFAPHLSGCMGLGGSRRGAGRSTKNHARLPSDAGRANSPYLENGHLSDDSRTPTKNKGKSKANREDDAEFSVNRKRTGSPSISPLKKNKKQKTGKR
ncbi:hypothetical protein EIP86_005252 [Pleurotus ostreatoroseus]|nr:hypothetical protein EIP86_005252 [Pleurotus ostreatoroseus]